MTTRTTTRGVIITGSGRWRKIYRDLNGNAYTMDNGSRLYFENFFRCDGMYAPVIEWDENGERVRASGLSTDPFDPVIIEIDARGERARVWTERGIA